MLAGNIADFARSVRTFSDPAPALSGNQGMYSPALGPNGTAANMASAGSLPYQ